MLSLIVAMSYNRVIGKNGSIPWHVPEDMRHFKKLTTGHHIVMGRATYESIGKPLPNRTSVVITRNPNYKLDNVIVVNSPEAALEILPKTDESFVIGGAQIYKEFLPYVDTLYISIIHIRCDGDTFFPDFEIPQWNIKAIDHGKDYTFWKYKKRLEK